MSLDFNLPLHWTIYSGDTDSVVPLTATRYSIDALSLPTITKWYPWYYDEEVSLGHHYIKTDSPITLSAAYTNHVCNGVDDHICRLVDGAKCTRVWRWWRSEVQGTRFPSTVHGRAWSSSSTSCETSPCPSLLRASSRSRTCCVSLGLMNKAGLGKPSSHSPPHFQVDMHVCFHLSSPINNWRWPNVALLLICFTSDFQK